MVMRLCVVCTYAQNVFRREPENPSGKKMASTVCNTATLEWKSIFFCCYIKTTHYNVHAHPVNKARFLSCVFVLAFSANGFWPKPNCRCSEVKEGVFYSNPNNSNDQWRSERKGAMQTEINLVTGDTSTWQVSWENDCQYTLKYLSGGKQLKKEETAFLKEHSIVFAINAVTSDYYIISQYIDKAGNIPFMIDTMWRREIKHPTDKRLFSLTTEKEIRKARFKDTSKYALLYVYRPSKLVCSFIDYPLFCNSMLMCNMASRSAAYVFKIWKEGPLWIEGQNNKHKDREDLDIQFGQKYYLLCNIRWSASRCIPYLSGVDKEKGEAGFLEAQY